jgi:hypothetical protein
MRCDKHCHPEVGACASGRPKDLSFFPCALRGWSVSSVLKFSHFSVSLCLCASVAILPLRFSAPGVYPDGIGAPLR